MTITIEDIFLNEEDDAVENLLKGIDEYKKRQAEQEARRAEQNEQKRYLTVSLKPQEHLVFHALWPFKRAMTGIPVHSTYFPPINGEKHPLNIFPPKICKKFYGVPCEWCQKQEEIKKEEDARYAEYEKAKTPYKERKENIAYKIAAKEFTCYPVWVWDAKVETNSLGMVTGLEYDEGIENGFLQLIFDQSPYSMGNGNIIGKLLDSAYQGTEFCDASKDFVFSRRLLKEEAKDQGDGKKKQINRSEYILKPSPRNHPFDLARVPEYPKSKAELIKLFTSRTNPKLLDIVDQMFAQQKKSSMPVQHLEQSEEENGKTKVIAPRIQKPDLSDKDMKSIADLQKLKAEAEAAKSSSYRKLA